MNREKLNRHKQNKRELALIDKQIDRLYDRLEEVPEVKGKVSGSSKSFPYIETHTTVRMAEPKAATAIKDRIREKEIRQEQLMREIDEVRDFIEGLPESDEKKIAEMFYLDDEKQCDIADAIGYTQGRVSQILSKLLKD